MKKVFQKEQLRSVFEALGKDPYSLLWQVVDDMAFEGHTIEVQSSRQFYHVVIDGGYYRIAPNDGTFSCGRTDIPDKRFTPLDYVMEVVLAEPRTEDRDAKIMLDAGYERDKSFETEADAEEYMWNEYISKDKPAQIGREFVDDENYCGFRYTVWI